MITVKEVTSKKELKAFVKFPFKLYKNNPYWVPPLISEELITFNKDKNPAFLTADAQFFLALQNNEIVGRVAAIINHTEINEQSIKKMRFGWFDFIDNKNVSKALLNKVEEIGIQHKLEYMEGPVGFSNLDKVGVLSKGYDQLSSMISWYNHPYYIDHFEHHRFTKEKEYIEATFSFEDVNPDNFKRLKPIIEKRYQLKLLNFNSTKQIMPYVDDMFDLFNASYAKLASFVPISEPQKKYFKEKYISFINPEYISFVTDANQKLVGFAIVMPSFSRALQKANGRLFPFGFYHLLQAKKHSKEVLFYLIGILPEYQNKGVHALIFDHYYDVFTKNGIESCVRTPELEENTAIHQIWKHFNSKINKRRRTYRKDL